MLEQNINEQVTAELAVRPLRFGYIINRDNEVSSLLQVYQYNSSLWGGRYNLFVPTDGKAIRSDWQRQLLFHDPDVILLVGSIAQELTNELYKQFQPMQIWQWDEKFLDYLTDEPNKINAMLMDAILESIYVEKGKLESSQSNIRYPVVDDGPFAPYLNLICGTWYEQSQYLSYTQENLGADVIVCNPTHLRGYLEILDELEKWVLPLQLTGQNLNVSWNVFGLGRCTIILSTGMVDDLFIYHALRWSGRRSDGKSTIVLIPQETITEEDDYRLLAEWFGKKVGGNTFDIVSYSVDLQDLVDFRDKLRRFLPPRNAGIMSKREGWVINIERCNLDAPVPKITHIKRQHIINVMDNRYSLEIVKPSFLERLDNKRYNHRRWICDLDLSPGFGNKRGFAPSMFADLNFLLSNYPDRGLMQGMGSPIRIARGKLALLASLANNLTSVRLPADGKIIRTSSENSGYQVESDNSVYYQEMMNLLDGFRASSILQNSQVLRLFSHRPLIQQKAFTIQEIYKRLQIPRSEKPDFESILQTLANRHVLLRGYNLTCPVCGLTTWYALDRVHDERMTCEGCRSQFPLPLHLHFAYRLNQLFVERQNQGAITVLLTLSLLFNTVRYGFIWQGDITLQKDDAEVEVDIIAMCDGYLVFAECKNSFMLGKQKIEELMAQLERNIEVAVSMGAHLFLFSTLQNDIPEELTEFLTSQDEKYDRLRVRLLTNDELISGKFKGETDNEDRQAYMYHVIGQLNLSPLYSNDDCSQKDEHWPQAAVSVW